MHEFLQIFRFFLSREILYLFDTYLYYYLYFRNIEDYISQKKTTCQIYYIM